MGDLLQYLKLVPGYVLDLIALLSGPKRFLADRNSATQENLAKAFLFFLISSVIALIFRAYGLDSPTDFTTLLLRSALAWGAALLVAAVVIAVSWAIVRKPVAVQAVLLTQAYILAILIVVLNIGVAAEANVLAMYRPELYNKIRNLYRAEQFDYGEVGRLTQPDPLAAGDPVVGQIAIIQLLAIAVAIAWVIATWGAYRHLNGASRIRSALAFTICLALFMPVVLVGGIITRHGYSLR